jgi:hypothetical protein
MQSRRKLSMSKNRYTRDSNSSEVVNIIMQKAEEAMFLIRRPVASGYQNVLYSVPVR